MRINAQIMHMVYLYKKEVEGKNYYYLRASEKKGKRLVTKDIAYLGSSLEDVKKNIGALGKYKEEIRHSYKIIQKFIESNHFLEKAKELKLKKDKFLEDGLAQQIEACGLHFNSVFMKKNPLTREETFQEFLIEFAYNSASIEGNTITLKEAKNLLIENRTPKNRTLREIYDLQNSKAVFFELLNFKKEITHDFIQEIHKKLMENIDSRAGYRTEDVRIFKSHFDSTPAPYVKTDMDLLIKWFNENKSQLHAFVLAVIFHHKFEKIHPFMDGNGRTGRMLMNYILLRNSHPPCIILRKNRNPYLDALSRADMSGITKSEVADYKELVDFSAESLINSYWNLFL